jgi:hypothetical protein
VTALPSVTGSPHPEPEKPRPSFPVRGFSTALGLANMAAWSQGQAALIVHTIVHWNQKQAAKP